jgi:nicotinamidase/pyrazinamidase
VFFVSAEKTIEALLIVDPQNDFMPGGSLAVPDGDKIFSPLNALMPKFDLVIASQDWHPKNHSSFVSQGGIWPPHCIQGSSGAEFHSDLDQSRLGLIVRKGYLPNREQYSCFDNTGLAEMLKCRGIRTLYIGGVATDYCVLQSTLGALEGNLKVVILTDCIKAVNLKPNDGQQALKQMTEAGAQMSKSTDLI